MVFVFLLKTVEEKLKIKALFIAAALAIVPLAASASLMEFKYFYFPEATYNSGFVWKEVLGAPGTGRDGHLYMHSYATTSSLNFRAPVTLNSFQLNSMPWEGLKMTWVPNDWILSMEAFDKSNNSLWSRSVDLAAYDQWNEWLTVDVNVSNVSKLVLYRTGNPLEGDYGFWPSLDNMYINEAFIPGGGGGGGSIPNGVPEPSTLALLGIAGLGFARRRRGAGTMIRRD